MNNKHKIMDFVIITAGGIGKRMEAKIPKQFLKLAEIPILMHTIKRFYDYNNKIKIIISLPAEHIKNWNVLCEKHMFTIKHKVVAGGKTRFYSIKNALAEIKEGGFVAVHDGVRPLVNIGTIIRSFESAKENGSGVASLNIDFSIRKIKKTSSISKNRDLYKEIQTPQTFKVRILKKAYKQNYDTNFTDDASVVEKLGENIFLTQGNKENIKITSPFDILLAESILKH